MFDLIRHPGDVRRVEGIVSAWRSSPLPAVILGAAANGLSFLRSLGRRGIPLLVLEGPASLPALRSRYAHGILLPDPVDEEERWLDVLGAIGEAAEAKPVLIPTGDALVLLVSRNRERLARHYRFLLPDEECLEKLTNKGEQYRLAASHGIPIPKTYYPKSEEDVKAAADEIGFPCIVKPYFSHLWKRERKGKLAEAADLADLLRTFADANRIGQAVLLQEKVPGGDDALYGLLTYYNRHSEPLALFTKRKLRQNPLEYGDGSFQVSVRVPEVLDLGDRFFRAIGYKGLGSVEFKKDSRTGEFKLMEVNPRSVSGQSLTTASGVDTPYIAYADIGGVAALEPQREFREDVYWISFRWDLLSFLENRRRGNLTLREWVGSLLGRKVEHAFLDWRDPAPALTLLGGMVRSLLLRGRSRVGGGNR